MEHNEANSLVSASMGFVCRSQDDAIHGQTLIDTIKEMIKKVKEHHRPAIDAAHTAHKQALAAEKRVLEPLDRALATVKSTIDLFIAMEREKARQKAMEEQRRAQEEARAAAAREAARIDEERRQAMLAASPDEPLPILEAAPAAVAVAPPPPPPVVTDKLTDLKAAGIRTRLEWKWSLRSLPELCMAVAEGRVSEEFVTVNTVAINREVVRLKDRAAIPGIRVYQQEVSR